MPTVCSGSSRLLRVSADLQRLRIAEDGGLGKQIAFLLKAHGFRLQEQRHGQLSSQCGDMADNLPRQRTVISDNYGICTVLRQPETDDIELLFVSLLQSWQSTSPIIAKIVTAFGFDASNRCRILRMIFRPEFQMNRFCVIRNLHQFFI